MDYEVVCNGHRSGRRLPSWMLPCQKPKALDLDNINDDDNTENNNRGNTECNEGINDSGKLIPARRTWSIANKKTRKRKSGGGDGGDGEEVEEEKVKSSSSSLQVLVRCKERKKRRKQHGNDVAVKSNGNDDEITRGKAKCGGKKRRGGKPSRSQVDSDDIGEVEGPPVDRDDDLTVEDLMSIAQEYVNVDKETGQRASSSKDDLTVEDLVDIAKEYVKEETDVKGKYMSKDEQNAEGRVRDVAVSCLDKDDKRLSEKEEVISQCFPDESLVSKETTPKLTMSGDPAQDMLDLLLGPLLKKPKHEEKFNVIAPDISFAHEIKKQKQDVATGDEAVPLMKKKSSLKDKQTFTDNTASFKQIKPSQEHPKELTTDPVRVLQACSDLWLVWPCLLPSD